MAEGASGGDAGARSRGVSDSGVEASEAVMKKTNFPFKKNEFLVS